MALGREVNTFTAGSILFFNGTSIAEDNHDLFWDYANHRLLLGDTTHPTHSSEDGNLRLSINGNASVQDLSVQRLHSSRDDMVFQIRGADGGPGKHGKDVNIHGGKGGLGSTWGGNINIYPGQAQGAGAHGIIQIQNPATSAFAKLDVSQLAGGDRQFTLPNVSGTFGLLETNQTWGGLNSFEAETNSTIYVGSSVKSGCIALGDSDGSGVTYITANDGVLTASMTKPSICK